VEPDVSEVLRLEIRFGDAESSTHFDMDGALGDPSRSGLPSELSTAED